MNESSLVKTSLFYGSWSGITVFLFNLLLHLTGINIFGPASLLGIWIPIVFITLAMRYHRNHSPGGYMSYGQGLVVGFFTSLFSATLFGLAFYILGALFDHGILDAYRTQAEYSLEEGKDLLSESIIDKAMESIEMVTIESLAFSESFNKLLGGSIVSLIIALIVKRPAPKDGY